MRKLDDVAREQLKTELSARWRKCSALRAEFAGNFNTYFSYKLGELSGRTSATWREPTGTEEFLNDAKAAERHQTTAAQAARLRASTKAAERRRFGG